MFVNAGTETTFDKDEVKKCFLTLWNSLLELVEFTCESSSIAFIFFYISQKMNKPNTGTSFLASIGEGETRSFQLAAIWQTTLPDAVKSYTPEVVLWWKFALGICNYY